MFHVTWGLPRVTAHQLANVYYPVVLSFAFQTLRLSWLLLLTTLPPAAPIHGMNVLFTNRLHGQMLFISPFPGVLNNFDRLSDDWTAVYCTELSWKTQFESRLHPGTWLNVQVALYSNISVLTVPPMSSSPCPSPLHEFRQLFFDIITQ